MTVDPVVEKVAEAIAGHFEEAWTRVVPDIDAQDRFYGLEVISKAAASDVLAAIAAVDQARGPDYEPLDDLILGDAEHPDTRDYVATNLLAHIDRMPNTGDWHGQLRQWAELNSSGTLNANPEPPPPAGGPQLTAEEAEAVRVAVLSTPWLPSAALESAWVKLRAIASNQEDG